MAKRRGKLSSMVAKLRRGNGVIVTLKGKKEVFRKRYRSMKTAKRAVAGWTAAGGRVVSKPW